MKKSEKREFIIQTLENLYPIVEIPLDHINDFTFLIAVMLSAQSTDKKVNEITPDLFSLAPNPEKMVDLGIPKIKNLIRQIGLAPTKAKNIFMTSEILIEKFNSKVPDNFEDLESLPGVGHKTSSVIMSQIFKVPAFPVDTHIHRLAQRWGLTNGKSVVQTEIDLKRLFPKRYWNKLHLQIIYYGREYCKARECYGISCKICTSCYPKRKKPIKTKKA